MKSLIFAVCIILSSFAHASYTPNGLSVSQINSVTDAINLLASEEYATNPWPYYRIENIKMLDLNTYLVVVSDQEDEGADVKSFKFTVTEDDCGFSVCSWTATLDK